MRTRSGLLGFGSWARLIRLARSFVERKGLVIFAVVAIVALPTIVRADDAPSLASFEGQSGGGSGGIGADASTGTASARFPLVLPPARGAIQPILGLSYAHTARRGVTEVGAGWSLGLPTIERHHRLGGRPKFDLDVDNIFRLNGARLVQIPCNGVAQSIAGDSCAGEPMPHWSNGWFFYRPEVDSSYTRAFMKGDGLTWRLMDRSGAIVELGKPTILAGLTFELEGGYDAVNGAASQIYRWKPVRQFEAYATGASPKNIILYSWRHWETGDVSTLEDIFYTPPAGVGIDQTDQFAHHVHLRYGIDRPWRNPASRFVDEQPWLRSPERVADSIEVSSKALGPSRALVRRYWLSYQTIGGRPYLTNVVMEGRCASPIYETSEWDGRRNTTRLPASSTCPRATPGTSYTYSHAGEVTAGSYLGARPPVKMVFDAPLSHYTLVAADANRDGLTDLTDGSRVHINGGRAGEPTARAFASATVTVEAAVSFAPRVMNVFGTWDDSWGVTFVTGVSAMLRADGGPHAVAVLTQDAAGWALKDFAGTVGCCSHGIPYMPPPHVFGDLDGDGLSDVLFLDENVLPTATKVRLSKRLIAAPPAASHGSTSPFANEAATNLRLRINSYAPRLAALGDINGDGAVDYITTRAPCAAEPGFPSCDRNPLPEHPNYADFKTLVFIPGRGNGNFGCTRATPSCTPAIASPGYDEFAPASSVQRAS